MKIDGYSVLAVGDSEHEPIHNDNSGKGIAAACRNTLEIDSWHLPRSATQQGSSRKVWETCVILSYRRITVSAPRQAHKGSARLYGPEAKCQTLCLKHYFLLAMRLHKG